MSSHSQQESSQQISTGEQLLFTLAELRFCLPISAVAEVLSSPQLRPVPFAASYIVGLANVRSHACPVIDLHNLLFCRAPINFNSKRSAYIALAEQQIVLAVDSVLGIEQLEPVDCPTGSSPLLIASGQHFQNHEDLRFQQVSEASLLTALHKAVELGDEVTQAYASAATISTTLAATSIAPQAAPPITPHNANV